MPVSVINDTANVVNTALRESLTSSSVITNNALNLNSSLSGEYDSFSENLQIKLVTSTKHVLLSKIEYEEVENYSQSVLDTLKSKYKILKSSISSASFGNNINGKINSNRSATLTSSSTLDEEGDSKNKDIKKHNSLILTGQHSQSKQDLNRLPQPKLILYPRENVRIGWKCSNRKWQIGAGMINVGNTCYLNSTLQALFHVPAMANWLISDLAHREKCENENTDVHSGSCIICAVSKTLISSQQSQSAIRPYLVYTRLKLVCKHLIMGRQEDAHEFLRYLVEAMEKSYLTRYHNWKELDQYSKETTPLNQILGGYLRSTVRCLSCGHVSTTFQHFQDLLLDIRKANSIEEALDVYFARERLEDMGYKCEACKKKVSATKQFSLERAPISLCIQLKRFSMIGTKLNKHVGIRPKLDLSPYASKNNGKYGPLMYRLVAMVTHLGSSQHCGHYTAIGITDGGGYYQFDDSCVRPISLQSVLNTNAYIIFYELDDSIPTSTNIITQTNSEELQNHNFMEQQTKENHHKINRQSLFYNNNNNNNSNLFYQQTSSSPKTFHNVDNSKILTTTTTTQPIIGPQLPYDHVSKSSSTCTLSSMKQQNELILSKSDTQTHHSKLANYKSNDIGSTTSSSLLITSPKTTKSSNQTQQIVGKIDSGLNTTQLKNRINVEDKDNNKKSSIISELQETKFQSTSDNKKQKEIFFTSDGSQQSSNVMKLNSSEKITQTNNKLQSSVLPTISKTISNKVCLTSEITLSNNSKIRNTNQVEERSIKSLVPYESDDDDDNNNNNNNNNNDSLNNDKKKSKDKEIKKANMENERNDIQHEIDDNKNSILDENSKSSSSPNSEFENLDLSAKSKTPPSPVVIKSKSGFWKVTNTNSSNNLLNNDVSEQKKAGTSFIVANKTTIKDKKMNISENTTVNNTVNKLLKLSHRGYGAQVLSWKEGKTNMEREIMEESHFGRKRKISEDEGNQMDGGKQKKYKIQNYSSNRNCPPTYNVFQEYQNQEQQRRWGNNIKNNMFGSSNKMNFSSSNGNRYTKLGLYRQNNNSHCNPNNPFNRNNRIYFNNHNNNNSNHHQYHNKKMHNQQRYNGNKFHNKRDS